VWDKAIKKWELYDLSIDRCETRDLATANPKRVAAMSERYFDWAEEMELKLKD
jgi:arylsulfatase